MTLTDTDPREWAARHFEPRPRRWPLPADLARTYDPATRDSLPLQIIDRELVRLTDHEVPADALAIFMPAQEGKSSRVSRWFPQWVLAHDPTLRVAIVSYNSEMAVRWGRQILRDLRTAGSDAPISVMADTHAAGRWDTPEGGGLFATGIGGALTGQRVDVLCIDDPVKDREEAESVIMRERAWEWWENVAIPRLAPGAVTVLVQTRWHEDDLAGRILSRPGPLRWRVLTMPALSQGPGDPLGRPAGGEFPSVRDRAPDHYTRRKATTSPYVWSSIYQQNPTAVEGNFFRRTSFRYWRPVAGIPDPAYLLGRGVMAGAWLELDNGLRVDLADPACWRFATCDVAASEKTSADYTVVSVWAIDREGDLILLDRARGRVEMADHFAMAKPLRDRWKYDVLYVPREYWTKTLVVDARNAGVPVAEVVTDSDKVTRAIPAAGRLHARKVFWPAAEIAPWLDEWESELASFNKGSHDDQVDTFSAAARVAAAHWVPPLPPSRPERPPELARIEWAHAAATGNGEHPPDLMTMPLG
jgi:predicted phage terminase large subunit-like protein